MDTQTIYRRRWVILSVLIVGLLAIVIDNTVLNVALKTIAEPPPAGLGASQSQLEWAINSYTLVFAGLLFTFGVIGDCIGRKRALMVGLALFGLCALLLTHFWWGSVFLINVPVTAVGLVAALFLVPESRNPAPGRIDFLGVLGSVLGLVLLVYGVVPGGDGASWLSAGVLAPL